MDDLAVDLPISMWPYEMIAMENTAVFLVAYQIGHRLLKNEILEAAEP